jgi:hypothetical protein
MSRGGLNFFLALYIIVFLILVTPFGAMFYLIFGKIALLIALSSLALSIIVIYMHRQETIKGSVLIDLVVLLPVLAVIVIWRLLWIKLNHKDIGVDISNGEIILYFGILGAIVVTAMILDEYRSND